MHCIAFELEECLYITPSLRHGRFLMLFILVLVLLGTSLAIFNCFYQQDLLWQEFSLFLATFR